MLLTCIERKLIVFNLFILTSVASNSPPKKDNYKNSFDVALHGSNQASISQLEEAWLKGDVDAGGHLSFAKALGSGLEQDIHEAIKQANGLLPVGAARAYTTLGLLLNHNLTEENLSKEERENKAIINFAIAAVKGDPIAQLIVGEHYYSSQGDCMSALTYYRKVASQAILSVKDAEIARPTFVQYVWQEDSPLLPDAYPTLEQLHFLEHLANHGETDAALQVASLLFGGTPGIKSDKEKGAEYLKLAVKGNSTQAMVWLAQMYLRNVIDGDDLEALELLETALKYGNDLANAGLGRIYMEGRAGLNRDMKIAESYLKKGMSAGNLDAFYLLGKLYAMDEENGGTSKAAEMWQIPAAIGHVHSAWHLAEYYRKMYIETTPNLLYLTGPSDMSDRICDIIIPLYRLVAHSGEWKFLFEEAYSDYISGRQGSSLLKYLLLSDIGYVAAHVNAARIIDESSSGIYIEKDASSERSLAIWQRAARDGVAKGHTKVGDHLYYGFGVEEDLTMAAEHYKKASMMGDPEGGFNYALVTEWGEGVPQDIKKAKNVYEETVSKHPESEVPVFFAMARLKTFLFINETLKINLYLFDYKVFEWSSLMGYLNLDLPEWDIIVMICLTCFIFINLRMRR